MMQASAAAGRVTEMMRSAKALAERTSHVSWSLVDQAVVSGANFLTGIIIARFLGAAEFGRYAIAWSFIFLIYNVQASLITGPMMTIGPSLPGAQQKRYMGGVLVQQLALCVLAGLCTYSGALAAAYAVPGWRLDTLAAPLALLAVVAQLPDFLRMYFYYQNQNAVSFTVDFTRYGIQTSALLALFVFWPQHSSIANALHVMWISALASALVCCWRMSRAEFSQADIRHSIARHWLFSRWLLASSFLIWFRDSLLNMAVGAYVGLTEAGLMRAAQQLVAIVNMPLQALAKIAPSRASSAYTHGGSNGLTAYLKRFVIKYIAVVGLLPLLIAVFAEPLLTTLYGAGYAPAAMFVRLFTLIMAVYLCREVFAIMLRAMQMPRYEFYSYLASAVILATAIVPMIQGYGVKGALIAELISGIASFLVLLTGARRRLSKG